MPKVRRRTSSSSLRYKPQAAWSVLKAAELKAAEVHAERYRRFLTRAKTVRECVEAAETELRRQGFVPLASRTRLGRGDRVFKNVKGRALAAAVIGDPRRPWRLVGAHVDSPRLDGKPNPLFEDASLACVQTHYYGGIKKYQWVNVPLALHAVVPTDAGLRRIVVGEAPGEPRFLIPDLPIHLARDQMDKKAKDAVEGEQLRLVVGNRPLARTRETEKVKEAVLDHLHRAYGLTERDLLTAELVFVPAGAPVEIGFDRSLVAAYGQDDRACVFAALQAVAGQRRPAGAALALFVDKEETGSEGDAGARSRVLENFTAELVRKLKGTQTPAEVLERSAALSADTTEALNPNFKDTHDARNASHLGRGVSLEKYGGGGGKYGTSEASAEFMHWLTALLDKHRVPWQTGEMGKVDLGGGGTIGMYLARYGLDVIDAGPPLLSMHSPYELASKVDLYCALRCYEVFLGA